MEQPINENQPLSRKQLRRQARMERKAEEHSSQTMKRTTKRIVLWGSILIVIGLIVWGFIVLANQPTTPTGVVNGTITLDATDHVKGNASSTVTLVEYGDFQCPACGSYYPIVKQVTEQFASSSRFVFRHFPLTTVHQNAMIGAQASEAAAIQGKFWEMYNMLFQNQTKWSDLVNPTDTFAGYANTLGLNVEQFKKDLTSSAVKSRVQRDMTSGNALGVNSTPTFYLNGNKILPKSLDEFRNFFTAAGAK